MSYIYRIDGTLLKTKNNIIEHMDMCYSLIHALCVM